jgi:hypothetical protein
LSDLEVRELERRFRACGAVEDEVLWLRVGARSRAVAPDRIELAAFAGHMPAREALCGLAAAGFDTRLTTRTQGWIIAPRPLPIGWIDRLPMHRVIAYATSRCINGA